MGTAYLFPLGRSRSSSYNLILKNDLSLSPRMEILSIGSLLPQYFQIGFLEPFLEEGMSGSSFSKNYYPHSFMSRRSKEKIERDVHEISDVDRNVSSTFPYWLFSSQLDLISPHSLVAATRKKSSQSHLWFGSFPSHPWNGISLLERCLAPVTQ